MESIPQSADIHPIDAMSANEVAALVESARALRHAADSGTTRPLLRGKKFGLLCGTDDAASDAAALFDRAAGELGAQVAHIRPRLTDLSPALDVQQTAHMLGRLYDAVVCEGMAPALVRRLSLEVGVPVYDRIGSASHLIAQVAGLLGTAGSVEDTRRFVLQALLLKATT
jgi:ornithine carbamoyltransferase